MRKILAMFLMTVESESGSLFNTVRDTSLINHELVSKGVNI